MTTSNYTIPINKVMKIKKSFAKKLNEDLDELGEKLKKRNDNMRLSEKDKKRVYCFNINKD